MLSAGTTERLPLTMMAKPVGATCNLDCAYCYYLEKEKLYPDERQHSFMNDKVLETFIAQTIYSNRMPVVPFAWHGGEPVMRGREFFDKVIFYQRKHGTNVRVENSIQTNGTTLTDDWCRYFRDNKFLVGISIDGPEHCHNHYRKNRQGQGSYAGCMKGMEMLVRQGVEFNTLTTVNDYNAKFPLEVYRFLKSAGSRYMQFLPVVEWIDPAAQAGELAIRPPDTARPTEITDWTVDAIDYGNFLIAVFDEWVRNDVGDYFVITFDGVLANRMNMPPPACLAAPTCGHAGVVEFNGDVYSCDHYVFPEHRLGNILDKSLLTLMNDPRQVRFGNDKRDTLPGYCRRCRYLQVCNGECPKHRIIHTPDGEPGLNYLCPGLKNFYRHSEPFFDFMVNELLHNRPPSNVKKWAQARPR